MASVTLDDLDLRILGALQADASLSNLELSRRVHASAPTCLRRVRALREAGVIARQIVIVDPLTLGPSLTAVVEVSLDRQAAEDYDAFESYICAEAAVTQCYRVSPGPDFVVIAEVRDMAEYDALARRLFKSSANIRNVRTFFSTRCAKFEANAPVRPNVSR
ncbi:Lrp/AsnC family transcriptional regulator [Pandoraea pulmonicola]|uniref:AsnC family transcriptional regulator n=1 Tax=Pandoraea pulmonicola TaxID=93221 RepID=A0AAJ5CZ89_PANPU|nr:Lrp/AsnC family transcriptional regulator [Pandoraea pulmonicola]AJC21738.1 AsnC family transcriptional regulator [Pandoraea pulmonicola]SUA89374.1 Leucine-responsive regulatory protein [Pandoraea pulmonicola]